MTVSQEQPIRAHTNQRDARYETEVRPINFVKWGLGCAGLSMLLISGTVMAVLIMTPVLYRSLSPAQQESMRNRLPFLAEYFETRKPTPMVDPHDTIPTAVGPSEAEALALLGLGEGSDETPESVVSAPSPTVSPTATVDPQAVAMFPLYTNTPVLGSMPATATAQPTVAAPPTATATATAFMTPTLMPYPVSHLNPNFQHVLQGWNNCGPANITQALAYYGWMGKQEDAAAWLKPSREDRNVTPQEMVNFVNQTTGVRALMRIGGDLEVLKRLISQGFPVIVEVGLVYPDEGWMGHYVTLTGYDDSRRIFNQMDTWRGERTDTYEMLDQEWQQFNRTFIVVYPSNRESDVRAALGPWADPNNALQIALSRARNEASTDPGNGYAWYNLGSIYTDLKQYKEATIAFARSQSTDTVGYRMLWYQFTIYEAYYNMGNYNEVINLAAVAIRSSPYIEEAFYWRGLAMAAMGNTRDAVAALDNAIDLNPNFKAALDVREQILNGMYSPPVVASR
jgi:TolA-binding protein